MRASHLTLLFLWTTFVYSGPLLFLPHVHMCVYALRVRVSYVLACTRACVALSLCASPVGESESEKRERTNRCPNDGCKSRDALRADKETVAMFLAHGGWRSKQAAAVHVKLPSKVAKAVGF